MKSEALKNGLHTEYHKNGQKLTEENYKDGKLNGRSTNWYENGQIEAVAIFKDNEGISGDCDYFKDV